MFGSGGGRGLPAHDVKLQPTLICVLVASGESEGFARSRACTHSKRVLMKVEVEGGMFDGVSGVAWSRLRQDGGSNPYHSLGVLVA